VRKPDPEIHHLIRREMSHQSSSHFGSASALIGQRRYVRVTGTRDDRFVEFEFSIDHPELAVELILSFEQFGFFCEVHCVTHLSAEEGARLDWERMKWRYGEPGLDH
jgi:phenol hydroxylase P0 protein